MYPGGVRADNKSMTTTQTTKTTDYAHGTDPGGTARASLRVWLWLFAGGLCALCGQATVLTGDTDADNYANNCHLLPDARGSKMVTVGNHYNGCRYCNVTQGDADMRLRVPLFELPHAVPTAADWPTDWKKGYREVGKGTEGHRAVADSHLARVMAG